MFARAGRQLGGGIIAGNSLILLFAWRAEVVEGWTWRAMRPPDDSIMPTRWSPYALWFVAVELLCAALYPYVDALRGWRGDVVRSLRAALRAAGAMDEAVKWGHLVYAANGPVLYIRAEPARVRFGFWRGQRLQTIEPRLKGSGHPRARVQTRSSHAST